MSLDVLLATDGAREAVMAALEVPAPVGRLLIQYIGLFRPSKNQMSFDRVARLLGELLPMLKDNAIERNGVTYPAPLPYWREAIEEMLAKRERLTLPLKSHGYLLEIIAGIHAKADSKAEAKREADRQSQPRTGGTTTTFRPPEEEKRQAAPSPERRQELLATLKPVRKALDMPSKEDQLRALDDLIARTNPNKEHH